MSGTVPLSEVVAALQFGDGTAFLDKRTGQIVTSLPDPEQADGGQSHEEPVPSPDEFEPLPILSEQNEIEFARQFVATIESPVDHQRLQLALSSENPHDAFEIALFRCQIANAWFQFRDQCLVQFAKSWLEARGIPYGDDVTRPAD